MLFSERMNAPDVYTAPAVCALALLGVSLTCNACVLFVAVRNERRKNADFVAWHDRDGHGIFSSVMAAVALITSAESLLVICLGDRAPRRGPQSSQVAKEVEGVRYSSGKGAVSLFTAPVTDDFVHSLMRSAIIGLLFDNLGFLAVQMVRLR